MIGDVMREAGNMRLQVGGDWPDADRIKRVGRSVGETAQAVSLLPDAFSLHVVEHLAHLLGRKLVMIEKRNEARNGPLEVDVVFPQRVVGVDEESLRKQAFGS